MAAAVSFVSSVLCPPGLAVLKVGGSVLTGHAGYRAVAAHLAARCLAGGGERLLAVVSAEFGHTDALLDEAVTIGAGAASPDPALLDLLWSTGETRSVALLALHLQACGVDATGLSVHETGLEYGPSAAGPQLTSARVAAALATHRVVVVPGFLAVRDARIVSLGRGGSDWSAVALAAALGAARCELVKDVDGYYSADPAIDPAAHPLPRLSYREALRMADQGCPVLQRPAILAAAASRLPLTVRSLAGTGTVIQE